MPKKSQGFNEKLKNCISQISLEIKSQLLRDKGIPAFGQTIRNKIADNGLQNRVSVIWAPQAKPTESETGDFLQTNTFAGTITTALLEINRQVASRPFMSYLYDCRLLPMRWIKIEFTQAKSQIESITIHPISRGDFNNIDRDRLPRMTFHANADCFKYETAISSQSTDLLKQIVDYVHAWQLDQAAFEKWLQILVCRINSHPLHLQRDTLLRLATDAVKHFALIAMFMKHNELSSVDYLMSPTIDGRPFSSMLVCWKDTTYQLSAPEKIKFSSALQNLLLLPDVSLRREWNEATELVSMMADSHRVGHLLKNRVNLITQVAQQQLQELQAIRLSGENFENASKRALIAIDEVVKSVAKLTTLMDVLSNAACKVPSFERWTSTAPLNLPQLIKSEAQIASIAPEGRERIRLMDATLSAGVGMKVVSSEGKRFNDEIYRGLFSEIMLNCLRHGTPKGNHVELEVTSQEDCIFFRNECKQSCEPYDWMAIQERPANGGFGLIAALCKCLKVAQLMKRVVNDNGTTTFELRMRLLSFGD